MLSICIPIYNFDITELVKNLHVQASDCNIPFEILLIDDASEISFHNKNKLLSVFKNVDYIQLSENIGRSKIRNLLAKKANYENLLFLDCDAALASNEYLKNYINRIGNYKIISGGRIYTSEPPAEDYYFHWYYGTKIETKSENFMSNNFLIKSHLWNEVQFNEKISQYGHEDTLFQIELKRKGINIEIINNPVIHIGLDKNQDFLSKNEKSVENLFFIVKSKLIYESEMSYFRLLLLYQKIKKLHLTFLFSFLYKNFNSKIKERLLKKKPNLFLFSIYKFVYFVFLNDQKE